MSSDDVVDVVAMPKTWRELESEGVRRCCAHFRNGKRCRRRASETFEWSWCDKHGPIMKAYEDFAMSAVRQQARKDG